MTTDDFEDIAVTRTSQLSGIRRTLTLRMRYDDYLRWQEGTLIQEALPYLTPDQREFLMTGITEEEWEDMFGEPPVTARINGGSPDGS
jgi:hypothetical protein